MKQNIQNAINAIEASLTATELKLDSLGLTTEDLIYIFSIEKYKSFFENLTKLDLSYNKIKELPKDIFNGLKNLKYLYLSFNEIKKLSEGVFSGLKNLKYLYLSYNQIKELPKGVFSGLENLNSLYLYYNEIKETQQFDGLKRKGDGLFVKQ